MKFAALIALALAFMACTERSRPYLAQIRVGEKKLSLGCFATENEAALAYNTAATLHFGEFARLNTIEDFSGKVAPHV